MAWRYDAMQQMLGMRVERMLGGCLSIWLHIAALSQHFSDPMPRVGELNQSHQNIGIECRGEKSTIAAGWFLNSVWKDAYYLTIVRRYETDNFGDLLYGITAMEYYTPSINTFAAFPQIGIAKEWGSIGVNMLFVPGIPNTIQPYQILFLQFKVEI